jgi:hypothetical protein
MEEGAPKFDSLTVKQVLEFNMNNTIPMLDMYIDDSNNDKEPIHWTKELIDEYVSNFTLEKVINHNQEPSCGHIQEPYNNASIMILMACEKYGFLKDPVDQAGSEKTVGSADPVKVAVIGSITPWVEALIINCGLHSGINYEITTVEYNVPICEDPRIKTISFEEFKSIDNETFDLIISYSSIEHSGLGRYGDLINPVGDLFTMSVIHSKLKQDPNNPYNGLLFLGIPVGKDSVVFNAHRIYGPKRLELLFKDFEEVEWIGLERSFIDTCELMNYGPQPVIVLRKIEDNKEKIIM